MADIVMAYCSSHAPMMSAARDAAPAAQRDAFFGAEKQIHDLAAERGAQAVVAVSNEHFTNFFLENFPQLCIGLGEQHLAPVETFIPIEKTYIPGEPGLASHILSEVTRNGFDPAFSHELRPDHGIITVYYELDPTMRLPLVPIIQNCAVPPLSPLRRAYAFGQALGDAIRSYQGLDRVVVLGAGGLSHWIGVPRVGDIEEEFDRWFLERLERGELEKLFELTDDDVEQAGNGAHEIRSWLTAAGTVAGQKAKTLAYEPVFPWITGMGVVLFEPA
jgi:Catalytic LigB subunit of aromatic ring-opening dioxygenase